MPSRTLALVALLSFGLAIASEDHFAPFSKLHWEGDADRVSVDAAQTRAGLTSLRIGAFGRIFQLSQKDLVRFHGFIANDVALIGGPMEYKHGGEHLTIEFSQRGHGEKPLDRRLVMVLKDGRYFIGKNVKELLDQFAAR